MKPPYSGLQKLATVLSLWNYSEDDLIRAKKLIKAKAVVQDRLTGALAGFQGCGFEYLNGKEVELSEKLTHYLFSQGLIDPLNIDLNYYPTQENKK